MARQRRPAGECKARRRPVVADASEPFPCDKRAKSPPRTSETSSKTHSKSPRGLTLPEWKLTFSPCQMQGSRAAGAVAQLVRVPDCRSGGCGFESRPPRLQNASRKLEAFPFLGPRRRGLLKTVSRRAALSLSSSWAFGLGLASHKLLKICFAEFLFRFMFMSLRGRIAACRDFLGIGPRIRGRSVASAVRPLCQRGQRFR